MAEGLGSGLSRRRVLQGTAWSVPVVLIATAVPARASSLEPGQGLTFGTFQPQWTQWFWDNTAQQNTTAVTIAAYLQNLWSSGTDDPGNVTSFTYTVVVPVGTIGSPPETAPPPRWGLGSNSQGIASGTGFTLVGTPTLADGYYTLTFVWAGVMPAGQGVYVMVWVQADNEQLGQVATGTVVAQHDGGNTSGDSESAPTAVIYDVDDWLAYFKEYHGDHPIPADDPDAPPGPGDPEP